MIITQKKPMEELMAMVGDAKTVAIVGCNSCATACHTGGEPEVAALAKALEEAGKKVVGTTIADYCCMNLGVKGKMKPLVAAKPDCVVIGSIILQAINYGLYFLGVNAYLQYIIRGAIIIIAVAIDVQKYVAKK